MVAALNDTVLFRPRKHGRSPHWPAGPRQVQMCARMIRTNARWTKRYLPAEKWGNTMKSKSWLVFFLILLLIAPAFAGDPGPRDVKGIPKKNRYIWAIAGGTALGAGIGLLAPGGNKSVAKGALIGGSGASLFYLMGHPRVVSNAWRPWVAAATNTALGTGIGWTACDCNSGAGIGALVGGGGTVLIQGFRTSHRGLSKAAGVPPAPSPSSVTNPSH